MCSHMEPDEPVWNTEIVSNTDIESNNDIASNNGIVTKIEVVPKSEIGPNTEIVPNTENIPNTEIFSNIGIVANTIVPNIGIVPNTEFAENTEIVPNVEAMPNTEIAPNTEIGPSSDTMPSTETVVNSEVVSNTDMTTHFTTDQVFDTRTDLVHWCQEIGRKLMTVVVIMKSEKAAKGRKGRINLGCERGGVFRDRRKKSLWEGKEVRRVETKRCGCPFALKGVPMSGDQWKLEVLCGMHNHELTRTSTGHSYAGRLTPEEKQMFIDMSKRGVKPKEILETIKERNKENVSTMKTIYNARQHLRYSVMEDRTVMQQVMKLLLENQYVEWHKQDPETNEVNGIFWAHPESIQLAKCFPSVLMVDCTDTTNWFRMPLFEIMGATSTGKMFSVAFFFIETKREDNYVWALSRLKAIFDPKSLPQVFVTDRDLTLMNAINTVFPEADHLLCTCHISRSITTHCKEQFETNEEFDKFLDNWTNVTKSESQMEFVDRWDAFEITWAKFPNCLAYLKDTWLSQYKEHFVAAWTNLVRQHGNTTMNRADSAHSKLKKYLESSHYMSIWIMMQNMITKEITDVKASFEKSLTIVQRSHRLGPLKELRGFVSHFALDLLVAEISRSERIDIDTTSCGCVLRYTHGLPCAHEIVQFTCEGRPIPLSSIDAHWKKLSAIPTPETHCDLDYQPEMLQLIKRWEESNEEGRRHLLKKIKELTNLATTWLNESIEENITEGRPRKLIRTEEQTASSTNSNVEFD